MGPIRRHRPTPAFGSVSWHGRYSLIHPTKSVERHGRYATLDKVPLCSTVMGTSTIGDSGTVVAGVWMGLAQDLPGRQGSLRASAPSSLRVLAQLCCPLTA